MSQNLLINGGFETIRESNNKKFYLDNFYCDEWIEPTDCSTDIYRDSIACSDLFIKNIENEMDMCISVLSGNYAVGFIALNYYGYMEHVTGKLREPLQKGHVYKISFNIKFFGDEPFFSKGIGYKFSTDSIVFNSDELFTHKLSPYYQDLFSKNKIYADFEVNDYIKEERWTKYTTTYIAKGGEMYLTFGQFSFKEDDEILGQLEYLRKDASVKKLNNFVLSGKSKYLKYIKEFKVRHNYELGGNYYLLDDINVAKLTEHEELSFRNECPNCVDTDPMTITPSERVIVVDEGFVGELKIEMGIRLKPFEKYVLQYGKKCEIIIINTDISHDGFSEMTYKFKYPAKKLRKRPIRFFVEKTNLIEINSLRSSTNKLEILDEPNFKGILIKN